MRNLVVAHIVVIPDSFKGSLESSMVASQIRAGWLRGRPNDVVTTIAFADGGEGTLSAIEARISDARRIPIKELSPPAYWLLIDDTTAVVELALESGISLLDRLDPLGAHTFNFGLALKAALEDSRVTRILCALGGSASTDAGTGALRALGFRFLDIDGEEIALGGFALRNLRLIDTSEVKIPKDIKIELLADVSAPLLGESGAAAIFAPQKGATPEEVKLLEEGLKQFALVAGAHDFAGAGAAGGTAYGLCTLLGATNLEGAKEISRLLEIDEAIATADYVITGEGKFDLQSTMGKAVGLILDTAAKHGKESLVIAGVCDNDVVSPAGVISLSELAGSQRSALDDAAKWIEIAALSAAESFHIL